MTKMSLSVARPTCWRYRSRRTAFPRHLPGRADAGQPSRRRVVGHGEGLSRSAGTAQGDRSRQETDALAGDGLPVPSRGLLAASRRDAAGDGGDPYPNQAFRYGDNAWGIQFHGELTQMMQRWVVRGAHVSSCQARSRPRSSRRPVIWDMHLKRWLDEFLRMIFGKPAVGKSKTQLL